MRHYRKGFTLIEAIIYIALFGLLIGGGVVAAYNIFEGAGRGQTHAMLQEEGNFLLGKINWTLSGVQSISSPTGGTTGTSLIVTKWDTTIGNPINIALQGMDMLLKTGSNPAGDVLNNSNVQISKLYFLHTLSSGSGTNPETIEFSFIVSARTPNGLVISQQFATTTVSLRR
jgi:hypothetical protein